MFANVIIAASSAYATAISFGFVIGFTSPAIPKMKIDESIEKLNESGISFFSSVMTIGGLIGCLIAGYLLKKIGRKFSVIMCFPANIIGWLLIYNSRNIFGLILGRFLCGISSGMCVVISPLYLTEISPTKFRGMIVSLFQLSVTIGILLVYFFGINNDWRQLALYASIPSIVGVFLGFFLLESPDYCLTKNDDHKAISILQKLYNHDNNQVEIHFEEIKKSLNRSNNLSWNDIRNNKAYFSGLKIAIALNIFQQLVGINAIMFNSEEIMNMSGTTSGGGSSTVIIAITQVIATAIAVPFIEKAGRKALLLLASSGMALACIALSASFQSSITSSREDSIINGYVSLVSLIIYIIGFSLGWGAVPACITNEILPSTVRSTSSSIALICNWLSAFIVTTIFYMAIDIIGMAGIFGIFSFLCMISCFYVYRYVPETSGKTYEEIEIQLRNGNILP